MKQSIEIIPAVLPHSYDELKDGLGKLRGVAPHIQIDIVDGHAAKGKTWPYKDGSRWAEIVQQEHGIPYWEELDFEFDLMVEDPAAVALDYVHAGASRVIIHAAAKTARRAVEMLAGLRDEDAEGAGIYVGIALHCDESPDALEPFAEQFDFVQVMGIEHIGKQGEPLAQKAIYLLERLRHRYSTMPLQIDGGVKLEHVKRLVEAGATRLVSGSAIMGAEDPQAAYQALYNEANAH
jgi:ribulose-phosphate 3-epimerase